MPRARFGQNFLADPGWRERVFAALRAQASDEWLEIGAGHGEFTAHLARASARVVAIESDPRLVAGLREHARAWGNVEVVPADVLSLDLASLAPAGFRVFGSLPYYITSPILRRIFAAADRIASAHVIVQLEVAERIAARPGGRGRGFLSVLCQFYARPEIVLRIPPGAFRPRPKVASALVALAPPGERAALSLPEEAAFLEFVGLCFAQKRKTLFNNLRALFPAGRAAAAIAAAGLAPKARAEALSLAQFAALDRDLARSR